MTNDETMLREVDQALAEDQTSRVLTKNLPVVIGAALIVVAGVGGWQLWSSQKAAVSVKASTAYNEALKQSGTDAGAKAFEEIAGESGAYAALAKMKLAGDYASKGDRENALGLYREVYSRGAASKRVKDMARLRASYLSLADGRDAVLKDIGGLETDKSAIGYYAREVIALASLRAGDFQSSEEMFRKAATAVDAPEPIRLRAAEFAALAGVGKSGVEMPVIEESAKSEVDRYLEGLEAAAGDLSSVVQGDAAEQPTETPAGEEASPADPLNPEGNN